MSFRAELNRIVKLISEVMKTLENKGFLGCANVPVFLHLKTDKRNKNQKVRLKNADTIQKFGRKTQSKLDF